MAKPPGQREYAKIVAKAWANPKFREQLLANPVEVLRSEGIDVPERTKVVDLSTEAEADFLFPLPPRPKELDKGVLELFSTDKVFFGVCCSSTVGMELRDLIEVVAAEKNLKREE